MEQATPLGRRGRKCSGCFSGIAAYPLDMHKTISPLASCVSDAARQSAISISPPSAHRGSDDLLTASLGAEGLRNPVPPAFADAAQPTAAELRRRAIWSSWRSIADLSTTGGYGELYGSLESVPGREYAALLTLPGARAPHRVVVQVPDAFDLHKRCLVVAAVSGSRGVYGAIAVAGAWGLPRGCAVVHTDKAAGSDYFDFAAQQGHALDGRPARAEAAALAFRPEPLQGEGIAFKHAHSGDNPEADWGQHVRQAAAFGLAALNAAFPEAAPFDVANTRIIATGISNGGGAVLRAAEDAERWLDGVVAGEPNVLAEAPGARALYDYASEAALLMPCALPALGLPTTPHAGALCHRLAARGLLAGADEAARQHDALRQLRAAGWSDAAIIAGASSTAFDLWRAVLVTYASAYSRSRHDAHPCGYRFISKAPGNAEARAAGWADGSGIAPDSVLAIVDPAEAEDQGITGLECLRALWTGTDARAQAVQQGVAATRSRPPREGLPVIVVHGQSDGLIPMAFSSAPYVAAARAAGRGQVRFWQVENAQHFDAFLALPQFAAHYTPLLPHVYAALDALEAHLDGQKALPQDAVIPARARAPGKPLSAEDLARIR